jgi:hypothetical protein
MAMPERLEKLKATIRDLEAELNSLTSVDAETRGLLEEAVEEIQSAMHKQPPSHLEPHSVAEKLKEVAEQFESSHPNLFGIVSRVIDSLGRMGI